MAGGGPRLPHVSFGPFRCPGAAAALVSGADVAERVVVEKCPELARKVFRWGLSLVVR
jgi:hypothetical protein